METTEELEANVNYIHCVFFTCKQGTSPEAAQAQIDDGEALLSKIPGVKLVHSGQRDVGMQREVSVTDFDIGLVVTFDSKADYNVYSTHSLHMEYLMKHKAIWERVRVFDYTA